jgi:hypothetical protein
MRKWLAKLLLGKDYREEMKQYIRDNIRDDLRIHDSIMSHVNDVIMKKIEDRIQRRLVFINSEKILDEIVERLNKKQIR